MLASKVKLEKIAKLGSSCVSAYVRAGLAHTMSVVDYTDDNS
jgi:hypothetical protein